MFDHVLVNGPGNSPVYRFLKSHKFLDGTGPAKMEIAWNYEKFLVDGSGQVLNRTWSGFDPMDFEPDIRKLLGLPPSAASQIQIM